MLWRLTGALQRRRPLGGALGGFGWVQAPHSSHPHGPHRVCLHDARPSGSWLLLPAEIIFQELPAEA